jgi:preprotein translocase subunit SecA
MKYSESANWAIRVARNDRDDSARASPYGNKDPLKEYKKESYELFTHMMDSIEDETIRSLFHDPRLIDAGGERRHL